MDAMEPARSPNSFVCADARHARRTARATQPVTPRRETLGVAIESDLEFTLHSQAADVPVRLRRVGERWTAVARIRGQQSVGLAANPRAALEASLQPLDSGAVRTCLADLALLPPSIEIARLGRTSAG